MHDAKGYYNFFMLPSIANEFNFIYFLALLIMLIRQDLLGISKYFTAIKSILTPSALADVASMDLANLKLSFAQLKLPDESVIYMSKACRFLAISQ